MPIHRRRLGPFLVGGAAALSVAATRPRPAAAASRRDIDADVAAALVRLRGLPTLNQRLLKEARATLLFPRILSGGFIVGGQYGEGAALDAAGATRGYYSIAGVSFGFLAGAQASGLAMLFMTDEAVAALMRADGWEIGTGPTVVALDQGAQVNITASTVLQPVYSITFNQEGLMAALALNGTKITRINPDA